MEQPKCTVCQQGPFENMQDWLDHRCGASSGNSELLSAVKTGAKWMRWWLDQNECECECGHNCGKTERERELSQMEAAIAAAEGR